MPPGRTASCLIGGNTITKDFIIAHRILPLTAAITGISLDGIDNAVFAFFHDAHMIGLPVLGAGRTIRGIPLGMFLAPVKASFFYLAGQELYFVQLSLHYLFTDN